MNNETKSDTPETDEFRASLDGMREINQRDRLLSHARKLERERDEIRVRAEYEYNLRKAADNELMNAEETADRLERERDELRAALAACMDDSIELLGERGWWKDELRGGYAQRYEQTAENIRTAQGLLNGGQV